MALSKDDKEFIELSIKPIVQRLDAFQEINKKQDERLEALEKADRQNERVIITMDEWVKTRGLTCPIIPRIEDVEKTQKDNKATKKFIVKIGAFLTGFVAFIWGVVQLVTFFFN